MTYSKIPKFITCPECGQVCEVNKNNEEIMCSNCECEFYQNLEGNT